MQFSELVTDVRARLDESSEGFFLDTELKRWLNEAQREIARKSEVLQEVASTNITAGTRGYSVPSDFIAIKQLLFDAEGTSKFTKLQQIDFRDWLDKGNETIDESSDAQGTPDMYFIWKDEFNLVPIPDTNITNGLKIYYIKYPADLVNDTDVPDVPLEMQELMVIFANYRALQKDREFGSAQLVKAEYDTKLREALKDGREPGRDRMKRVKDIDQYPNTRYGIR